MDHLKQEPRKPHPNDRSNIISNIFFIYTIKLFAKGYKKELEESDLYEIPSSYRSKTQGDHLEREWKRQKEKLKNLSVVRLLITCFGRPYFILGLMQLIMNVAEVIIIPYYLGKLVSYFAPGQTQVSKQEAYFYAAVVIGFNLIECVYKHNYYILLAGFGIKLRAAFCSFMYRKALKLSPEHLGEISIGKIVTLMTKDVDCLETFVFFGNDIWIGIVKTIVVSVLLYRRIGLAAMAGVGFFLMILPLQVYLGAKVTGMKMKICKKTDQRLQITQEALSAVRIIKMYTWEKIFDTKISKARKDEVHTTFKIFVLRFLILTIGGLNSQIAFYLLIMSYIALGNLISAEIVYYIMSTFQTLSYGLGILFPIGVYQTAEMQAAIKRIGQVVKATEIEPNELNDNLTILPKISFKNVTVTLKQRRILENINLRIEKGLTLISGRVGSGKTILLKTILQEFRVEEGNLFVQGGISYASQEPWLFPSSIRQNILFGEKYDEKRYMEVLKVCALIYDFELLENGDNTIVEDRGTNLSKGQQARINLARAIYKQSDIYLLDDSLAALDAHVSSFIFNKCILKFLKDKLVVLVSHDVNYVKHADLTVVLENGRIKHCGKLLQLKEDEVLDRKNDLNRRRSDEKNLEEHADSEESKLITETTTERKVYQEEKKKGEVNRGVYKKYIKFGGGFLALFIVFCFFVSAQVSVSYTDKLVSDWVNLEEKISNNTISAQNTTDNELQQQRTYMFYMYSFVTVATTLTMLGRSVGLMMFSRAASIRLHKHMISTIMNASMQFFDTNFIGNILNRFSKDLVTVDEWLPFAFYHVFRILLLLIGIITLIASVNATFLIPTAIFLTILVCFRRFCLGTSRSLKRLDALTRSPVVGHLNATLEGLDTIRAFKAEHILKDEFDRHMDLYNSASFVLQCCMRGFAFMMDTMCGFFIAFIVTKFLIVDDDVLAGHVGLAISQAFSLTGTLQWGIRQWAELENRMTSVERVLEYTDVKQETEQGLHLEDWPKLGRVKYENVFLSYTNSNEYVLKNVSFTVEPNEKIGIVGRTGAGKSSIISTLFRLYEVNGRITIDDVDTKSLSLETLRSNISIIPQDPVLFTGTIRDNIDPLRNHSDDEIWAAIEATHLKPLVASMDLAIIEGGSHFSIGQRQLICLARAVVQNNKIIVLDEATSNMDPETDKLIHETIMKNFYSCTVFTIAHKLSSVLHCNKVMVMDKGEVVEYDEPSNLLGNKKGLFYGMVMKAGLISPSE